MATGLLLLTLGKETKIQDLLMSDKEYVGTLKRRDNRLRRMPTGKSPPTTPVPDLTAEQLEAAFAKYDGNFYQTPRWSRR